MFVFLIFLFQCIKLILLCVVNEEKKNWKKSAKSKSNDKMMRYRGRNDIKI